MGAYRHTENILLLRELTWQSNKFFSSCSGKKGIWITRLRLGLSPLNFHRYTYHLISEPYCNHCHQVNESTEHFLLKCPRYATLRKDFLKILTDIGVNTHSEIDTINSILYGTNFMHNPLLVIEPTIIFLTATNRFK